MPENKDIFYLDHPSGHLSNSDMKLLLASLSEGKLMPNKIIAKCQITIIAIIDDDF